jgi:glycosyltransferase involved in cell wall biosynthesis
MMDNMSNQNSELSAHWTPGTAPVAVVMISLNEGHNMDAVMNNLKGWAQEVYLVDSFSQDNTIDIALRYGVHVVQRHFQGFGDQWNFALRELPITSPWTMKLDPDERLSADLKVNLCEAMTSGMADGFSLERRLWLMGKGLPVHQRLVRVWRTGKCLFTDIAVNEHPIVDGSLAHVAGVMEHHDSPSLDHWLEKQNRYTTAEALIAFNGSMLADEPLFFGTALQRRMWLKKFFYAMPFHYFLLFAYHWIWQGAWKAGWVGYAWARLRVDVMRLIEYKTREMQLTGCLPAKRVYGPGRPDPRVPLYD